MALSLYKEISLRNDIEGENYSLHYLRDKYKHEIDFLICQDKKPIIMIELKTSDETVSNNFEYFDKYLKKINPEIKKLQLVLNLKKDFSTKSGVKVKSLIPWLESLLF